MRQASELRDSQQDIATHLYNHDEAICVLRPGGGKTAAALTAIGELIRDKVIRHALVVAPKRVARVVWPDEIEEWAHVRGLKYAVLSGTPKQRLALLHTAAERDLTIVGLDVVPWLLDELLEFRLDHPLFDLLVVDEISKLRDPKGIRAKVLSRYAGRWKMVWGLSGTLRPSGPLDLFMTARIVTRGKLWGKSFYKWQRAHFYPTDYNGYDWAPFPGHEETLNAELAPLLIAPEPPPQPEPFVVLDRIELPPGARKIYNQMERKLFAALDDRDVIAGSAAIASGKLSQIASGFLYDDDGTTTIMHDAKREWLADLIEDSFEPTLLVYEFKQDLRMIQDLLGKDLPYLGAGISDKQAADNIERWNRGELPFMGLHPASGGHGLNLQHGGATEAWIAPCWSAEFYEQTVARLNRSGQKRQVVIRLCTATDTVDEMKLMRVHYKMTEQQAFEKYMQSRYKKKAA